LSVDQTDGPVAGAVVDIGDVLNPSIPPKLMKLHGFRLSVHVLLSHRVLMRFTGSLTSDGGNEPHQLRDPHKRRHLIPTRQTATIELLTLEQGCRTGKETLPAAKEREHLERRIPARHGKGDSDWNYN